MYFNHSEVDLKLMRHVQPSQQGQGDIKLVCEVI